MIQSIEEIRDSIFLVRCKTQYEIASTFMRLQEFYESPYKGIRGQFFTLEQYMDRYAKETGDFTYTDDWNGFNVPGNVVLDFFDRFDFDLLEKEKELYRVIEPALKRGDKFYLLGIWEDADLTHEIAHGYYYLDDNYRRAMNNITIELKYRNRIEKWLKNIGYTKEVFLDEIQAYLGTGKAADIREKFSVDHTDSFVKKYRKIFKDKEKQVK